MGCLSVCVCFFDGHSGDFISPTDSVGTICVIGCLIHSVFGCVLAAV